MSTIPIIKASTRGGKEETIEEETIMTEELPIAEPKVKATTMDGLEELAATFEV